VGAVALGAMILVVARSRDTMAASRFDERFEGQRHE